MLTHHSDLYLEYTSWLELGMISKMVTHNYDFLETPKDSFHSVIKTGLNKAMTSVLDPDLTMCSNLENSGEC